MGSQQDLEDLMALLIANDDIPGCQLTDFLVKITPEEICDRVFLHLVRDKPTEGSFTQYYRKIAESYAFDVSHKIPELPWEYCLLVAHALEQVTGKRFFRSHNITNGLLLDSFSRNYELGFQDNKQSMHFYIVNKHTRLSPNHIDRLLFDIRDICDGTFIERLPSAALEVPEEVDVPGLEEFVQALAPPPPGPRSSDRPPVHEPEEPAVTRHTGHDQPQEEEEVLVEAVEPEPIKHHPIHQGSQIVVQPQETQRFRLLCYALYDISLLGTSNRESVRQMLAGSGRGYLASHPPCSPHSAAFFRESLEYATIDPDDPPPSPTYLNQEEWLEVEPLARYAVVMATLCMPTSYSDKYHHSQVVTDMPLDLRRLQWLLCPTSNYYAELFDLSLHLYPESAFRGSHVQNAISALACEMLLQPQHLQQPVVYGKYVSWVRQVLASGNAQDLLHVLGAPTSSTFPANLDRSTKGWLAIAAQIQLASHSHALHTASKEHDGPMDCCPEYMALALLPGLLEPLHEDIEFIERSWKTDDYTQSPTNADYRLQQALLFGSLSVEEFVAKPGIHVKPHYEALHLNPLQLHTFTQALHLGPTLQDWHNGLETLSTYIDLLELEGSPVSLMQMDHFLKEEEIIPTPTLHGKETCPTKAVAHLLSWLVAVLPFWHVTGPVCPVIDDHQQYYLEEFSMLRETWDTMLLPLLQYVLGHIPKTLFSTRDSISFHSFDQASCMYITDQKWSLEQRTLVGSLLLYMRCTDTRSELFSNRSSNVLRDTAVLQMASKAARIYGQRHPDLSSTHVSEHVFDVHNPLALADELASLSIMSTLLRTAMGHRSYDTDQTIEQMDELVARRLRTLVTAWEARTLGQGEPKRMITPYPSNRGSMLVRRRAGNSMARASDKRPGPKRGRTRVNPITGLWGWNEDLGRYTAGVGDDDHSQLHSDYLTFAQLTHTRPRISYSVFDREVHELSRLPVADDLFHRHRGLMHQYYRYMTYRSSDTPKVFVPNTTNRVAHPYVVFVLPDYYYEQLVIHLGLTDETIQDMENPTVRLLVTSFVTKIASPDMPSGMLLATSDNTHLVSTRALLAQHVISPDSPGLRELDNSAPGARRECITVYKPLALGFVS